MVSPRVWAQAKPHRTVGTARLKRISGPTGAVNGWVWGMVLDGSDMVVFDLEMAM